MKPRSEPRIIPQTRRYFSVTLEDGQVFDMRFPSYGVAASMVKLLENASGLSGAESLSSMLDVAGYAIGLCWCHRDFDLESGTPPDIAGGNWHRYGDDVIDEVQEHGLSMPDIWTIQTAIIAEFSKQMAGVTEGKNLGKPSRKKKAA